MKNETKFSLDEFTNQKENQINTTEDKETKQFLAAQEFVSRKQQQCDDMCCNVFVLLYYFFFLTVWSHTRQI